MSSFFVKASKTFAPKNDANSEVFEEWTRCAKFYGEEGGEVLVKEGEKMIHSLPWELERRLIDIEQNLMDIQTKSEVFSKQKRNRQQKIEESVLIEEEIKQVGNELNHYLYTLNMIDVPSTFHGRFAVVETIRKLMSGKLFYDNHKNGPLNHKKESVSCACYLFI